MARKSIWAALATALLALAPVASAATWSVHRNGEWVYATESITSGDVVIDYEDGGDPSQLPEVTFRLYLEDAEVPSVDQGDTIDVTFTLINAKFARNVRSSAMRPSTRGTTLCQLRVRSVDGEAGSASATFTVETTRADCAVADPGQVRGSFVLTLPPLTGLTNTKPVRVKVTTDAPAGSGWPSVSDAEGPTLVDEIIDYRPALQLSTLALHAAGSSSIDLAGGRTGFTFPGQADLGSVRVGRRDANNCTSRTPDYGGASCTLQRDGTPFSIGRGGDGRGDLNVTVTGDFRDGDVVFLDLDGDRMPGAGEDLDLQADGSMQESFRLDYVAGNPNAADGEAGELDREEGLATKILYYRPNGTDALRPGEYRSTFTVTTDSATVADVEREDDGGEPTIILTTRYTETEDEQIAYAIPPQRAGDSGTVRVNCKGSTPCTLYLECDDQDGMSHFAQVKEPVQGRSTLVLTAEDLSDALDLGEGAWETGRMSCTIHSTRDISVQQLTRSAAGVLVNNTYVDN